MQRTKKAYLNSLASFIQYVVRILVQFLLIPILVSGLGEALYGAWQIMIRSVGFISAADGRPTQALKWVIANEQLSDEQSLKRKAIGSALSVALIMLPIMATIGFVIVWNAPLITNIAPEYDSAIRVASAFLVLNMMLMVLVMLPESVLHGMNMSYKRIGLVSFVDIAGGLLTVLFLSHGAGITGVALALLVQTSLSGVLFWLLAKHYLPWFGVDRVSFAETKKFFNLSIWYSGWNFVQRVLISSDVVIIGLMISAVAVTGYTLTAYVSVTFVTALSMVVASATPGLGGLIGKKQYATALRAHQEMLVLSLMLIGAFGAAILLWNQSLVALWVGQEQYAGDEVNLLLVLLAMQLLFIRNDAYLIDATLDIKQKVKVGFIASVVMIFSAAFFSYKWGVIGVCIGLFLGRFILNVAYPLIICRFLKTSAEAHYGPLVRPFFAVLLLYVVIILMGSPKILNSWFELFLFGFLTVVSSLMVMFLFGLSRAQRSQIFERFGRLKKVK